MTGKLRVNQQRQQVRVSRGIEAEYGYSGSAAVSLTSALLALLGESAERYALLPRKAPNELVAFRDLGDERALNPQRIVAGVKRLPPKRAHLPMRWIGGRSVPDNLTRLIPRQLIEVPYIYARGEAILRTPITTGAAAADSLSQCIERGLLELIERDAFMLAWLTKARLKRIPAPRRDHADTAAIQSLCRQCSSFGLLPELRIVPCSFSVSVVAAFLFDKSECGPKVTVGASAAVDPEEASLKALLEALQLRSWLRSEKSNLARLRATVQHLNEPVRTIRQRAALLLRQDYAQIIQQWINNVDELPFAATPTIASSELVEQLQADDCTIVVVDLSDRLPRSVRDAGFHVAKVVVPELQPLWLNDFAQDISWKRLTHYSKSHGRPTCVGQTRIPHPFL